MLDESVVIRVDRSACLAVVSSSLSCHTLVSESLLKRIRLLRYRTRVYTEDSFLISFVQTGGEFRAAKIVVSEDP